MNISISKVQQFLDWMKVKLYLDSISLNAGKRMVKRGQIYRCNFGVGIGSEMQKDRPALIVQNDIGNMKSGNTIVAPITHDNSTLPCMVPLTPQYEADGVTIKIDGRVNTSNIMCISKARIGKYICELPRSDMKEVDEALAKTVGLMCYYSALSKKLNDKLTYIAKIKQERNKAQDSLEEIRTLFQIESESDIIPFLKSFLEKDFLERYKNNLDNYQ